MKIRPRRIMERGTASQMLANLRRNDQTVRIWDIGSEWEIAALKGHTDIITAVAFRPDGKLLASASDDGAIRVWDTDALES